MSQFENIDAFLSLGLFWVFVVVVYVYRNFGVGILICWGFKVVGDTRNTNNRPNSCSFISIDHFFDMHMY